MGTTTLMSLEEFERLDRGADHIELLKGELIRLPPAQRNHNQIRETLYDFLKAAIERCRRSHPTVRWGKVHMEMGYLLSGEPRSWLQPDVSLTHPDQPGDRYYQGAPLMVFEIVSEFDTARQMEAKLAEHLAHGSAEVWVIDPDTRHAWVYERSTSSARRENRAIRSPLLPAVEIAFADLF
ncbi:MAG TPA: Uma2 family endonuclease [Bryobacteraceae bacterium]|nr:Uma2 family endonuclease [Bryobacteraceae bacterium]